MELGGRGAAELSPFHTTIGPLEARPSCAATSRLKLGSFCVVGHLEMGGSEKYREEPRKRGGWEREDDGR
jgi:hypothetical protein